MTVVRFVARLGIPRNTWYYWRAATLAGRPVRRWPAPVVDEIEEPVAQKAEQHSAWGHRKIWGLMRTDGYRISQASVKRAMARRNLLLPQRYQAERRAMAKARRAVFDTPPTRRNRLWQTDFSEFETTTLGDWQLGGVVDYVAKVNLACAVTPTQTGRDAVAKIEAAIAESERVLGCTLREECLNPETGEIEPLVIVSDNGPGYKSDRFARFVASHNGILAHVRTRYRSPQTNGVIERFFESIKYEHLYRHEIPDAIALTTHVEAYRSLYNQVRPHEALGFITPMHAYLADPTQPRPTLP
jgi:transposase InsO family protein